MIIHTIVNSIFNSCTYILHREDTVDAIIIDCGDVEPIFNYLKEKELNPKGILITHSHFDHIYGLNDMVLNYPNSQIFTNDDGRKGLLSNKLIYHVIRDLALCLHGLSV